MKSGSQKSYPDRRLGATVPVVAIHALIPLFWLFCAMFVMPRFAYAFAQVDVEMPILFNWSVFMCRHWFVYLFVLISILIADGAIHHSLLRISNRTVAGFWLTGIVIIEAAISLLLFLPLAKAVMTM